MFIASPVFGITWHNATDATIAWDAVTELEDNTPIPVTDIIEYQVFIYEQRFGSKDNPTDQGIVTDTQKTISFTTGKWIVGVQARRMVPADTGGANYELAEVSAISWSDIPANCLNNQDFGIRVFKKPKVVTNLNKQ
jgi:hypothetical protein